MEGGCSIPAREMVKRLLAFTRPALEAAGDWEEVSALVYETLERGNGADRQRQVYEQAGRLGDVVDMLIEAYVSVLRTMVSRSAESISTAIATERV